MSSKKKLTIKPADIKYSIYNTELPVIITHDNKVYFDVDPKDENAIIAKNQKKIAEYQEKVNKTMNYLFLEGFLTSSEEQTDSEDSEEYEE
jgi:hypothetical protein